ncbi:MAG: YceI family protein [bacterium]|nr:YceI family protein [bacterium]
MKRPLYLLLAALLSFAAFGCANPADDAPDAVVQEPAAEPEPAAETVESAVYSLSADSKIGFVGAKVTGSHEGGFEKFMGTVAIAGGTAEGSSVEVTIDTTSLWADHEDLTGHLKSADFFDVENHPTATFESTGISANDDGTYTMTGNLDLHGVTKQISFPADIEVVEAGFAAIAEFSINRMDFEIVYPGRKDDLIRDEVLIRLDLRSEGMGEAGDGEGEAEAAS